MEVELKERTPGEQRAYWTRTLAECQVRIAELNREATELRGHITRLVADRNYLQSEVNRLKGEAMTDTERQRIQELLKIARQNEKRSKDTVVALTVFIVLVILGAMAAYLAYLSAVDAG